MKLIIVESPTKAKTLSRFLGPDFMIEATQGHLRDLPERSLGIEIEKNSFIPVYEEVAKKKEIIKKLSDISKKADGVILATDPDREGEAIAWHVATILKGTKGSKETKGTSRIVFHEITESAIKEALSNPRTLDMNLVDAQQARRILDRLVGYKLSPVLWKKIRRGLSAGRVQSVAVRLIVDREREIKAFKADEYWEIEAELEKILQINTNTTNTTNNKFTASLVSKNEKKVEIHNKDEADAIVKELEECEYKVSSVEKNDVRKFPYPPFTTSTLQQAGSNLFGWSAKQTMRVAQSLYEQGLITYHRTDSLNLAEQAVSNCRDFIKREYGVNYLPESPRFYKTKSKVAQEAHEAIRPTQLAVSEMGLGARDEERLFELIWKRFVACQMNEAIYEQTKITILGVPLARDTRDTLDSRDTFTLRAVGSLLKFDGWKTLYQILKIKDQNDNVKSKNNDEKDEENNETQLPELNIGELLNLLKLLPSQHFTEPPARYNEASLIKALEEKGIGRPSTYAPIISTIQERQYVEKLEKKFSPTVLGETVNDFLVKNFPKELDYDFTAKMEDDLDNIANGERKWQEVLGEFYTPFLENTEKVTKESERMAVPVEQTDEKCEKCGSPMIIRIGRFGKFMACSAFPKCKNTKALVSKTDLKCPKCGGDIIMRKTKRRRNFYGCSNYPNCDFAAWKKEDIVSSKATPLQPHEAIA